MALQGFLTLLFLYFQGMHLVSSEICYDKVCEYDLVISAQFSHISRMPKQWGYFEVDLDGRDLRVVNSTLNSYKVFPDVIGKVVPNPEDVITLDGVKRLVITVNGKFPAPTLEVTKGAQVVARVRNALSDQSLTVHWHGIPQYYNPWMDGVPEVTQCSIQPGHTFTYRFMAEPAGVYWYHSHVGYQQIEGLAGMLIVHDEKPTMPYFPIMVQDWYHAYGHDIHFSNAFASPMVAGSGDNLWATDESPHATKMVDGAGITTLNYVSGLIDGRGRYKENEKWPLATFNVTQNGRFLFRFCHAGSEYPLQVSIDSHRLRVTSVDGQKVDPIEVDSVILFAAERVDVEVVTDQPVGRYWMRSSVPKNDVGKPLETLAIVSYEGSNDQLEPTSSKKVCTANSPCTVLNCPFKYYPASYNSQCIHMSEVKRTYAPGERAVYGLDKVEPEVEHFVNLNLHFGATLNGYRFKHPHTPVYQTDSHSVDCDDCPKDGLCDCTYRLFLPYGKVVQMVFSNIYLGGGPIDPHPLHIHGHHFAVVRMGFTDFPPGADEHEIAKHPNPDVVCDSINCREAHWAGGVMPTMNLIDPPLKDSVVIPASGYAVLRFRSDNPGPWLLHCHMAHHAHQGPMTMLLVEAEDRFPPLPPKMPTCTGVYNITEKEFATYMEGAKDAISKGGFKMVGPSPLNPGNSHHDGGDSHQTSPANSGHGPQPSHPDSGAAPKPSYPDHTHPPRQNNPGGMHPNQPNNPGGMNLQQSNNQGRMNPPPPSTPEGRVLSDFELVGVAAAGLLGGVLLMLIILGICWCFVRQIHKDGTYPSKGHKDSKNSPDDVRVVGRTGF